MFRKAYKRFRLWFCKPRNKVVFNGTLAIAAVIGNLLIQVFCVPVLWASAVLLATMIPFILYPAIAHKHKGIKPLLFFIFGITASICIYCAIFLEHLNILGIPMLLVGIGILVFVPHFYLIQLFNMAFFKTENKTMRKYFVMGLLFSYGFMAAAGFNYNDRLIAIEEAHKTNSFENLDKNDYLTERIIGMHFKYHTRFNEYDGWRPPLHDPYLVAGYWLNGFSDPLIIGLEKRVELYKKLYPNKPVKVDCTCAKMYSEDYENDKLFN